MIDKIEPYYVTFNQAKSLKERGFDENCHAYSLGDTNYVEAFCGKYGTRFDKLLKFPEQWQVVEWLRLKYNIEVSAQINFFNKKKKLGYFYSIDKFDEEDIHDGNCYDDDQFGIIGDVDGYKTKQDAYSAAFDYILTNLI